MASAWGEAWGDVWGDAWGVGDAPAFPVAVWDLLLMRTRTVYVRDDRKQRVSLLPDTRAFPVPVPRQARQVEHAVARTRAVPFFATDRRDCPFFQTRTRQNAVVHARNRTAYLCSTVTVLTTVPVPSQRRYHERTATRVHPLPFFAVDRRETVLPAHRRQPYPVLVRRTRDRYLLSVSIIPLPAPRRHLERTVTRTRPVPFFTVDQRDRPMVTMRRQPYPVLVVRHRDRYTISFVQTAILVNRPRRYLEQHTTRRTPVPIFQTNVRDVVLPAAVRSKVRVEVRTRSRDRWTMGVVQVTVPVPARRQLREVGVTRTRPVPIFQTALRDVPMVFERRRRETATVTRTRERWAVSVVQVVTPLPQTRRHLDRPVLRVRATAVLVADLRAVPLPARSPRSYPVPLLRSRTAYLQSTVRSLLPVPAARRTVERQVSRRVTLPLFGLDRRDVVLQVCRTRTRTEVVRRDRCRYLQSSVQATVVPVPVPCRRTVERMTVRDRIVTVVATQTVPIPLPALRQRPYPVTHRVNRDRWTFSAVTTPLAVPAPAKQRERCVVRRQRVPFFAADRRDVVIPALARGRVVTERVTHRDRLVPVITYTPAPALFVERRRVRLEVAVKRTRTPVLTASVIRQDLVISLYTKVR